MLIVRVDTNDEDSASKTLTSVFGIWDDEIPTCRLANMAGDEMEKFKPNSKGIAANDIKAFIGDYLDGKLEV